MAEILHLEGNLLEIKGATKVLSSTQTQAIVEADQKCFILSGNNIEVKQLNLDECVVCFYGDWSSIKIGCSKKEKPPFLKRIFK